MPEREKKRKKKVGPERLIARTGIGKASILAAERLKGARNIFNSSSGDLDVRNKSQIGHDDLEDLGISYRPDSTE